MARFDLYFDHNLVGPPCPIKIGIDSITVLQTQLPLHSHSFDLDLLDGNHTLWIELCEKTLENQQSGVDQARNDTYIELQNLSINNSMMNYFLNDEGYVVPDWQNHKDVAEWFMQQNGHVPEKLEKSKFLNLKGTYYFHFSLPIKRFLDQRITIDPIYKKFYNDPLDRYIALKKKL
jgi:hypothetical protein